jgi:hypothetical protein
MGQTLRPDAASATVPPEDWVRFYQTLNVATDRSIRTMRKPSNGSTTTIPTVFDALSMKYALGRIANQRMSPMSHTVKLWS